MVITRFIFNVILHNFINCLHDKEKRSVLLDSAHQKSQKSRYIAQNIDIF